MSRLRKRSKEWVDEGPAHQDNAVHWPSGHGGEYHSSIIHIPEDGESQAYPGDRGWHPPTPRAERGRHIGHAVH